MYFVKYGEEFLHDPRVNDRKLLDLTLDCEENSCGYCDFTIYPNHPMYDKLKERDAENPIEVYDGDPCDENLLFSGFIYELGKEFQLDGHVKCKGDLDYLRESLVRPYSTLQRGYGDQAPSTVDGYFNWLIYQHNNQVNQNKRFVVGINQGANLDKNNYIYRENDTYPSTIDELADKLINNEGLGGYVRTRKVNGVRYIDYISEWTESNTQILDFGVNLMNYAQTDDSSMIATYILPIGASMSETLYDFNDGYYRTSDTVFNPNKEYYTLTDQGTFTKCSDDMTKFEANTTYYEYVESDDESNQLLTIKNQDILKYEGDFYKQGDVIYCESAVKKYGWIGAKYENREITTVENLASAGLIELKSLLSPKRTIEIKAVDMHLINPDIKSIRIGEYVRVRSVPHNLDSYFLCTSISLDLNNPENSTYTLGTTFDTLTGQQNKQINKLNATINKQYEAAEKISEEAKKNAQEAKEVANSTASKVTEIEEKIANIGGIFLHIKYSDNSDGSNMSDAPTVQTKYIGIYSGDSKEAPTDKSMYVWSLFRGEDGQSVKGEDGKSAYLHIKYSNDGETFTDQNGEVAGDWIGTYTDENESDSTEFSKYTWKKIKGEQGEDGKTPVKGEDYFLEEEIEMFITDASEAAAENIDVGGRNLVRYTDTTKDIISKWSLWGAGLVSMDNEWIKCAYNRNDASKNYGVQSIKSFEFESGQEYTLSFDIYATKEMAINYCYIMCSSENISLTSIINCTAETTPKRYSVTFKRPYTKSPCGVLIGTSDTEALTEGAAFFIRNIKLEKGNKATDWTPAPEDVDTAIDDAAKTATNYMDFIEDTGLIIGDMTSGTLGNNVCIDSDSVDIRKGEDVLTSFVAGTKEVELWPGSGNTKTVEYSGVTSEYNSEFGTNKNFGTEKYAYVNLSNTIETNTLLRRIANSEIRSFISDPELLTGNVDASISVRSMIDYLAQDLEGYYDSSSEIDLNATEINLNGFTNVNGDMNFDNAYSPELTIPQNSFKLGRNTIDNFVVEEGTSTNGGSWRYRKWSNGAAECWGNHNLETINVTGSYGNFAYSGAHLATLPMTFKSINNIMVTPFTQNNGLYGISIKDYTMSTVAYWLYSAKSETNVKMFAQLRVCGTWK